MSSPVVPYEVVISLSDIDDLRHRLACTRWPDTETTAGWSQGVPLTYVQELCAYWHVEYDMQRLADRLNAYQQFTTEIDGTDIHFLHVRSRHENATPLIMTHGWPGSVVEFLKVVDALSDPTAHGGEEQDAFHLVIPSLPGYGFSGKPRSPGWGIEHIASAWAVLMSRLGYDRYAAQGGDWGGLVTMALGVQDVEHLLGIHLNVALADPEKLMAFGELTEEEELDLAGMVNYQTNETGYFFQQRTRPQTLGYGLADSPAGQCAWIVEKFGQWSDCDGHPETVFTKDELLDSVMAYWVTGAATSAARLYWQSAGSVFLDFPQIAAPTAYSVFPKEHVRLSERWARTRFDRLGYYRRVECGGHFAAFERPDTFVGEVRAGFRALLAADGSLDDGASELLADSC